MLPIPLANRRTIMMKKDEIKKKNSRRALVALDISCCSRGKGREMSNNES
jgi:hypothetical protein